MSRKRSSFQGPLAVRFAIAAASRSSAISRILSHRCLLSLTIAILCLQLTCTLQAKVTNIALYRLGNGAGGVTYAQGPATLPNSAGKQYALQRHGSPSFIADAPAVDHISGCLKFDGKTDWYQTAEQLHTADQNFILETWVKTDAASVTGFYAVAALGNGSHGYVIGCQGDEWVALSGSQGFYSLAKIHAGQWVELAMVRDGNACDLYVNGRKVGHFVPTSSIATQFTIGSDGLATESFSGRIAEVRVGTFTTGTFDPAKDFRIDYAALRDAQAKEIAAAKEQIKALTQVGLGTRVVSSFDIMPVDHDWLVRPVTEPAQLLVKPEMDGTAATLVLTNGLISRTFYVADNLACTGLTNLTTHQEFVRSLKPEMRLQLNGTWYDIGGLTGMPERAYFVNRWKKHLRGVIGAFRFVSLTTSQPEPRYHWQQKFHALPAAWPPKGLVVSMRYAPPAGADSAIQDIRVTVHYQIFEGLPVISKWFTLSNQSGKKLVINKENSEVLAVAQDAVSRLYVASNYSFHLANNNICGAHVALGHTTPIQEATSQPSYYHGNTTTVWKVDSDYNDWATPTSYEDTLEGHWFRNLLISRLPLGPDAWVAPGADFTSFRTFELLQDADGRERQSLAIRHFYATVAPQTTQSILSASTPSHDDKVIRHLIDQMAELGFENLVITFWPGIHYENLDPAYVAKWKSLADYARQRGIVMGGYELLAAARSYDPQYDVVDPATGKPGSPIFGHSTCIASKWQDTILPRMWKFIDETGFDAFDIDGPYHGDVDAQQRLPYHHSLEDSQWAQWKVMVSIFHEFQRRNMLAPAPDWYFLNGADSTGMGYREAAANLPNELKLIVYRQYIYDGTWFKLPTMGQIDLSLINTYANDPSSRLEPLSEHLHDYRMLLIQALGSGANTTLRANRLYDSAETKAIVLKWVNWYKNYRRVLSAPIIHVIRPSGHTVDCILHVDPTGEHKGLAMAFNPTDHAIKAQLTLPLYYTGLTTTAIVRSNGENPTPYVLDHNYKICVPIDIPANDCAWLLIDAPPAR